MEPEIFSITPAGGRAFWLITFISLLSLSLLVLMGVVAWSGHNMRCTITPTGLKVSGGLYGRFIPMSSIVISRVSVTDLNVDPGSRPKWRTNGVNLPGQSSGWFQLRNGQKALIFLTDWRRVVKVPTLDGYVLMMSMPEPQKFIRSLEKASGRA